MGVNAILRRLRQIMRQQKKTVGARLLDDFRRLNGERGPVTATRDDRHIARHVLCRTCNLAHFDRRERKEFTRATSGKQRGRLKTREPLHVAAIAIQIELVVRREVRDREGQESRTDTRLYFFRRQ